MARRKNILSRNEIKDRVENAGKDMKEKEDILDDDTSDIETIRKTLENLEGGTTEGFEQIEKTVENAEDVTTEAFEKEDIELEEIQKDSEEFGEEIKEGQETSESDLAKISNASAEFKTKEPDRDFLKAKEQALCDIDILKAQKERERITRENSDSVQEGLRGRVYQGQRR